MKTCQRIMFVLAVICLAPITAVSYATTIFTEDFQSYAEGSNLSAQPAWSGDSILVGTGSGVSSKVANGRLSGQSGLSRSVSLFSSGFDTNNIYTLSFDAYATTSSPASHNSGVTYHASAFHNVAGWAMSNNPAQSFPSSDFVGWMFDPRYLTGVSSSSFDNLEFFDGGYDQIVTLSVVIDPIALEVWGIADFGATVHYTSHYDIVLDRFLDIDGVTLVEDFRSPGYGGEIDNINVTAEPVPEPATVLLLGTGLIGLAGLSRKRLRR